MRNAKSFAMVVIAFLVIVIGNVNVVEGSLVIDNPHQLVTGGNSQMMRMNSGDNLMERVDNIDYVVDKGEGEYYILFGKEVSGGLVFGAYLETDNDNSDNWAGYEGWCNGWASRNTFLEGESPDYVLAIYDDDGGSFGWTDPGVFGLDDNIVTWESGYNFIPGSGGIEYGGIVDGLLDIEFGANDGSTVFFESIVLTPVPEPATIVLLGLGGLLFRKRKK